MNNNMVLKGKELLHPDGDFYRFLVIGADFSSDSILVVLTRPKNIGPSIL